MLKYAIFGVLTLAVAGYGLYLLFPAAFKPSPGGHKRWAYLFGGVLFAEALVFVVAYVLDFWLPLSASSYSGGIDDLFYIILAVTGVTFIGVSAVFIYVLFKYPAEAGRRSLYTHGNHRLEMIWSGVPAVILILLGIGQIPAWLEVKSTGWLNAKEEQNKPFLQIEVTARQWEWRVRYASGAHMNEWGDRAAAMKDIRMKMPARHDDLRLVNEVHCIKGQKTLVHLKTQDVIHSFFLPHMRLKQDALPGKTIPVWFQAEDANCHKDGAEWVDGVRHDAAKGWVKDPKYIWELACAEYCGSRHSLMRGKVYVHEDEKDFFDWLKSAEAAQKQTSEK
jgi:cytochrome c oxidase subunit 2